MITVQPAQQSPYFALRRRKIRNILLYDLYMRITLILIRRVQPKARVNIVDMPFRRWMIVIGSMYSPVRLDCHADQAAQQLVQCDAPHHTESVAQSRRRSPHRSQRASVPPERSAATP